jgi:hypothetical protein
MATIYALTLLIGLPGAALAQRGGDRPAPPAPRAAAAPPAPRSAPAAAPRPVAAPPARPVAAPPSGFNLQRDIAPRSAPAVQRAAPAVQRAAPAGRTGAVRPGGSGAPANYARPSFTANTTGGPFHDRFKGPVIRNGHVPGGSYGWNHGVAWRPAPIYWGGGFWGPFAIASLGAEVAYGAFIDDQDQLQYPSYGVVADTPGAELLQDYGLQQTPCGPPNLVVIWGPDNSVVCAFPNDTVGPGDYDVDPDTLTLVSATQ